ncbi:hypothetical protein T09_13011 [Trichinella sp. T9]|nr:hypothetical protein T09_13011 [Trichinella sp. T9]
MFIFLLCVLIIFLQFVAPFHARMRWIWIDNLQIRAKQDSLNWLKIFPPLVKDLPRVGDIDGTVQLTCTMQSLVGSVE